MRVSDAASETQTALQRRLAGQIIGWMRDEGLGPGEPINQLRLAERFGVSRTPVKAALQSLSELGAVRFVARGVEVADPAMPSPAEVDTPSPVDRLIIRLAADRHRGHLPQDISEADLMRRYDEPRGTIVAALRRLAELGVVLRKPGFGWRFIAAETIEEKRASYSFRLATEPAALLEPGYAADPGWIAEMKARHTHFLDTPWDRSRSVAFFEMNAEFHLGLVAFSNNRFFIQATEQQNSLRRLRNYSWRLGPDRVSVSCREHLGILTAVGDGRMREAARLLKRHLVATSRLVASVSGDRS
jgi:DNA-binding GntR family transcriptional regulator